MANSSTDILFHNYPQSPVAEKVRVVFGMKNLAWRSVEIPRLAPKPMLTALTGGYRRTPVMQIGADIYCDSQCIIRELERRFPSPSVLPVGDAGLLWGLSRWTDGALFDLAVKIVLGSAGENLPADFALDRGRLYFGKNWAEGLKQANVQLPHLAAQMRAPMSWLDTQLADDRPYLLGTEPTLIDAQIYHVVWFIDGRWSAGPNFLSEFKHLKHWQKRVASIGHGTSSELSPEEAIRTARNNESMSATGVAANDPQGLRVADVISITPDVDGGEQSVTGTVRFADAETVTIEREDESCVKVCVHFPRAGYRIEPH